MSTKLNSRDGIYITLMLILIIGLGLNLYWSYQSYISRLSPAGKIDTTSMIDINADFDSNESENLIFEVTHEKPVKFTHADEAVRRYRHSNRRINRSYTVVYEKKIVQGYFDKIFPDIVNKFEPIDESKFRWDVGYYFYLGEENKLNYFVVPTLVDITKEPYPYLDYFNKKIRDKYYKLKEGESTRGVNGMDNIVYNFGHLYPLYE